MSMRKTEKKNLQQYKMCGFQVWSNKYRYR